MFADTLYVPLATSVKTGADIFALDLCWFVSGAFPAVISAELLYFASNTLILKFLDVSLS